MIRLPVIARLLGSVALVGLVGCSAETTTSNDPVVEQNAPDNGGAEVAVDTGSTGASTQTPEAKDFGSLDKTRSAVTAFASASVDIDTTPTPPPAPPAPPTCEGLGGDGSITVTEHSLSGFMRIDSKLDGKVVIKEGKWFSVQVETDANLQGSIKAEVDSKGTLLLEGQGAFCASKLEVVVTLPVFRAIKLEGSGSIEINTGALPGDIDIALKGSGSIKFDGNALALDTSLEGDGKIVLANGTAVSSNIKIDGSGTIDATGFKLGTLTKNVSIGGSFKFSL